VIVSIFWRGNSSNPGEDFFQFEKALFSLRLKLSVAVHSLLPEILIYQVFSSSFDFVIVVALSNEAKCLLFKSVDVLHPLLF